MKKILIFNHATVMGGAGRSLLYMIDSLPKNKYDITVYCTSNKTEIAEILEGQGIKVIRAIDSPVCCMHYNGGSRGFFSPYYLRNQVRIYADKKNIAHVIRREKPDIIAVNSMTLYWIGEIAKKMNIRSICFHRETYAQGLFGFRTAYLKRKLDQSFSDIVFISRYDLEETHAVHAHTHIIHDCVDIRNNKSFTKEEARELLGVEPVNFYVLFMGGMSTLKGIDVLMRAVDNCKYDDIRILVINGIKPSCGNVAKLDYAKLLIRKIAKSNEEEKIAGVYEQMNHKERLIFLPAVRDLEACYSACNAVVFPSTKAHQAMPIYESGFYRRPIIISGFLNTEEFISNGQNGITFEPLNSMDLAAKIDYVYENRNSQFLTKMIENNYEMTMRYHTLSQYQKQIREVIEHEK